MRPTKLNSAFTESESDLILH